MKLRAPKLRPTSPQPRTRERHPRRGDSLFFTTARGHVEVLESRIAPAAVLAILAGENTTFTGDGASDTTTVFNVNATHTGFYNSGGLTSPDVDGVNVIQFSADEIHVLKTLIDGGTLTMTGGGGTDDILFNAGLQTFNGLAADFDTVQTLPALTIGTGGIAIYATDSAADLTIGGDISVAGGSAEFRAGKSIIISGGADVTSSSGAVAMTFNADRDADSSGGFYISASGTQITTNGGDLTIGGGASPATTPVFGPTDKAIFMTGATLSAGAGNISIRGQGDAVSGGGASIGIDLDGTTISTTTGNITVVGTGGAVTDTFSMGVSLYNGSTVSTATGAIAITGTTSSTGANAYGVKVQLNSKVEATGNGSIAITGTGGSSTSSEGVAIFDNGDVTSAGSGSITITGTGNGTSHGIITGSGANDITIGGGSASGAVSMIADSIDIGTTSTTIQTTGTATLRQNTNGVGIDLGSAAGVSATLNLSDAELDRVTAGLLQVGDSNSGAITISAALTHGNNLALTTGAGVTFNDSLTINVADRNLTVTALGTSNGTINLSGASSDLATSGTGSISLTTARNITMASGSSVTVVNGNATLSANQQVTPTSGNFIGIHINGGTITTSGTGALDLSGRGGDDAGTTDHNGIRITSTGLIQSTASGASAGTITLIGTGGSGLSNQQGIVVQGPISTVDGEISVTGTGGAAAGQNNKGIHLFSTGSITSTGTGANAGDITLTGYGNATTAGLFSDGVGLPGGTVASVDGDISISGTSYLNNNVGIRLGVAASPVTIQATGDGAITFTGIGSPTATLEDIYTQDAGNLFGAPGGTGGVTFNADSIDLTLGTVQNSGTVTIQPTTPGSTISLGGSSTLDLTDAELDNIVAPTIVIGNGSSGAMSIDSSISRASSTNLTLNAGANTITFTGGSGINAAGGTVTFNSGGITGSTGTEVTSTSGTLVLNTTGAVAIDTSVANFGASTISGGAVSITNATNVALTVSGAITNSSALTITTTGATTGNLTVNASITGTGADISLNAARTLTINDPVTTTGSGAISFSGNSGLGARDIIINDLVSTVNGALSIDADRGSQSQTYTAVTVNGPDGEVSVSGTGTLTVAGRGGNTSGVNIGVLVQGGGVISGGTSGTMTISGQGGANPVAGIHGVRVTGAGSTITSLGANVSITGIAGGNSGSSGSHGVSVNDGALITSGGVGSVTISGTGGGGTGGTNTGVFLGTNSASITSGGGAVSITAIPGSSSTALDISDASASITTALNGGNLTLIADSMNIVGTVSANGVSTVTLRANSAGQTINLGAADSAGVLGLTDAELDLVTGGTIAIGHATNTGGIVVSAALTQGAKAFTFTTSGSISGAGSLAADSLTAAAGTGITLNTALTTLSATNSTSGSISISEADSISVSTFSTAAPNSSLSIATTNGGITVTSALAATGTGIVSMTAGGTGGVSVTSASSGSGAITLTAANGSVTMTGAVSTSGAAGITLSAGGSGNTLTLGGGASTGSGAIALTGDLMALNGAANSISSTGALTLLPVTAATSIGLGDGAAGTFNLTGAELATLANGFSSITIGRSAGSHIIEIDNNGTLTFNDPVLVRTGTAGGSITLAADTPLVGAGDASITLTSAGAATLGNSITTSNQNITVNFGQAGGAVNITVGVLNPGAASASVTGGAGANIITLTSTALPLTVTGGGGSDTLVAPNTANTWDLAANTLNTNVTHSGITTLQGGSSTDNFAINASRTQNLKGGGGTDSFVLSAGFTLTGSVDGEAGTDTLDLSAVVTSPSLTGAGSVDGVAGTLAPALITAGFDNIDVLNGSGTFTGANTASTWAIGSTMTYTTGSNTVTLSGYTALQGGSGVDIFNVVNGHAITTISAGDGNDTLNLSYSGGAPIPLSGLTFHGEGNTGSGDSVTISGGAATTITHTFANANDGTVNLDGRVLTYTGLEPIIDSMSAVNRVFTFNGGAETITLTDDTGANMTIDSTAGESVTFANPSTSITINAGNGNDTINVVSMDAAYAGSLTINGDADTDSVTITATSPTLTALTVNTDSLAALPSLAIGAGGLNLTTTTSDITQTGAISVTGTTTLNSGAGSITLTHASNNFVGAVSATKMGAGTVSLNDSAGGINIAAISAAAADVTVTATAGIIVAGNVSADTLTLGAGTTITQTGGFISTSGALTTTSIGDQMLTSTTNAIAAFIATNTLAGGDIELENGFNGFDIGPISNNDGPITINNTNGGPSDTATVVGTVDSGGTVNGDVYISTSGELIVNSVVTTAGGSGGALTLSGWITLAATPVLGAGDITLVGGPTGDLHILTNLTFASTLTLSSARNVIIEGAVTTTGANSDIILIGDTDLDGVGGVYIKTDGFVGAGRDVIITGSELTNDLGFLETNEAIRIDADGTLALPVVQVQAVRNMTFNSSSAAPTPSYTAIGGYIKNTNTGLTVGNIEFTNAVEIIDDLAFVEAGGAGTIIFHETVDGLAAYDLMLRSTIGNIQFLGAVGSTVPLGAVTVVNVGVLTAASTIDAESFTIVNALTSATFSGTVTTTGASGDVFSVDAPTLSVEAVSAPGGGNILWETDNLAINGMVGGIGELTIRPITTTRSIGINGTGDLNISAAEIALLQDGFDLITFGRTNGSGTITTAGSDFLDSVRFLTPTGIMNVNGKIETIGPAQSIEIQAKTLNLDVSSATEPALQTEAGSITILNTAIVLLDDTELRTSTGAAGGDMNLTVSINGAFDLLLDAFHDAAGGDVTLRGLTKVISIGGTSRPTSFTVDANNIDTAPHTYTNGDQEFNATTLITTHGGAFHTNNAGSATFNGDVHPTENLRVTATDAIFTGLVLNQNLTSLQLLSNTTALDTTVTLGSTAGLFAGQAVSGVGIPAGTTIVSVDNATDITISAPATANGNPYLVFGSMGASTLTASAALGTDAFTLSSGTTAGLYVGQPVFGAGIPAGAVVTDVTGPTTFEISMNTTTFNVLASITGSTLKATAVSGTNSFTLNSGTTGPLSVGQAVTGTNVQPGTVIASITGPTTFTTTLATLSNATNPRVGVSTNSAVSVTALGLTHFMENVGVDAAGVAMPLNFVKVITSSLVTVDGEIRTLGAIQMTANEIDFNGGDDTINGSTIELTATAAAGSVILGTSPENGASPQLELSEDDVNALGSRVGLITIASTGNTAGINVNGPVTFNSPTKLWAQSTGAGFINVNDTITMTGAATLELNALTTDIDADITSEGGKIVFTSLHQHLGGKVNITTPVTVSSTDGAIEFRAILMLSDPLIVTTSTNDVLFNGPVFSTNTSDLTVNAPAGDVTFNGGIGVTGNKPANRPGHIQINSGGVTTLGLVDTQSLETDAAGTTVLKRKMTSYTADGFAFHDPVTIFADFTIKANNSGNIEFFDTVQSTPTARALTLTTVNGNIHLHDDVGSVNAFRVLTWNAGTGDLTADGTINTASLTFKGAAVTTNALITTTGSQTYTGTQDVTLGELSSAVKLTVTSAHDISSSGPWTVAGRATLKSTSLNWAEGITVTGAGNSFGELHLTGRNAEIETDDDMVIVGGKISRAANLLGGQTTLTSFGGSIIQAGPFETWRLIADAQTSGSEVDFSLGSLRVAQIGPITADSDIYIVRSAPGNLRIQDDITSTNGNIVLVANNALTSTANADNNAGANPISAGGYFIIYAHDESVSLGLLSGISAPTYSPLGIRYSNDPFAPGHPDNIGGTFLVFRRA